MTEHSIEVSELLDAVSDEFAGYNVGDTISILHDNQMGEPEKYKVLLTFSGKKILSDKLIRNDPPEEYRVSNLEKLKNLLNIVVQWEMGNCVLVILFM